MKACEKNVFLADCKEVPKESHCSSLLPFPISEYARGRIKLYEVIQSPFNNEKGAEVPQSRTAEPIPATP